MLPPSAHRCSAEANLRAAVLLLQVLQAQGLRRLVLCPGSRSAPLAVAAGLLAATGLELLTAVDERSAAFLAVGLGRADGRPAALVTTSGTAVANLLPAVVEADHGAVPLLLLTADRPARLKGCGANQTVNQEEAARLQEEEQYPNVKALNQFREALEDETYQWCREGLKAQPPQKNLTDAFNCWRIVKDDRDLVHSLKTIFKRFSGR